jgi:hypothetical protein
VALFLFPDNEEQIILKSRGIGDTRNAVKNSVVFDNHIYDFPAERLLWRRWPGSGSPKKARWTAVIISFNNIIYGCFP